MSLFKPRKRAIRPVFSPVQNRPAGGDFASPAQLFSCEGHPQCKLYRLLADVVVVVHAGYVLFVVTDGSMW